MKNAALYGAALLLTGALTGCASVPRVPAGPAYPDLPQPEIPARLTIGDDVRQRHDQAWKLVQAGDLRAATREYNEALKRSPTFYPAETGLGLVALASRQYKNAVARFNSALVRDSRYVPAWRGLVSAELAQEHLTEAASALERLIALDPSRAEDRTRLELLKVKQVQQLTDTGRRAREAGRLDEAEIALNRALGLSPASPMLMRELALVDLALGRVTEAEGRLRRAIQLDPTDADSHAALGAVLQKRGRLRESATEYARAAAIDTKWKREAGEAAEAADRDGLPDELRDLRSAPSVTRAHMAALLGLRLNTVLARAPQRPPAVATDVRTHWAAQWITPVVQAGVMDVFTNHTFQPGGVIQRSDLARIIARLVPLTTAGRSPDLARWQAARPTFPDVPTTNANYRATALAVTVGALTTTDGRFVPSRPATGAEVLAAVGRLEQLERLR